MQMTIGVSRNWSGTRLAYCTMLLLYSHQDAMESVWTWSGNRDIRMTIPLSYFMTGWSWLCFDSSVHSPQTSWCIYHCIAFCREEEACFYNGWLWMGTRTRWGEIEVKCSWNPCKRQNLLAMERGCDVIICATHGSLCSSMDWSISGIAEILVDVLEEKQSINHKWHYSTLSLLYYGILLHCPWTPSWSAGHY